MVIRKPYAFLIKHFKLVHLILALPLIYIVRKTHVVVSFFNSYVSNGYSYQFGTDVSGLYINWVLYLSIFVIIISILSIYYLLKYKEKPVKMYIVMLAFYLFLFFMLIWYSGIISGMAKEVLPAKSARLYRDISLIIYLPQYFFIAFTALRAVGFNIKSFNFQNDLKEMQITSEDNEEVEVGLGFDTYKTKRFLRRYKREFSYYLQENKLVISIVVGIALILFVVLFYKTRNDYNVTYSQNQSFEHQMFTINVTDSIITNVSQNGEKIDDKYYLVLKAYVRNNAAQRLKLDYDNLKVIVGNKELLPVLDRSTHFIDYANPYYGDYFKSGEERTIALAYKIDKSDIKKSYKLKILSSYNSEKQKLVTNHAIVKLTPVVLDKILSSGKTTMNNKLILSNTNVGNTIISINNYIATNSYMYEYTYCQSETDCRTAKDVVNIDYMRTNGQATLLVLDYDFDLDKDTIYGKYTKNDLNFFEDFVMINCKKKDKEFRYKVYNITPSNLKNKLVLQVNGDLTNVETIDMYITIRNKRFTINLK